MSVSPEKAHNKGFHGFYYPDEVGIGLGLLDMNFEEDCHFCQCRLYYAGMYAIDEEVDREWIRKDLKLNFSHANIK